MDVSKFFADFLGFFLIVVAFALLADNSKIDRVIRTMERGATLFYMGMISFSLGLTIVLLNNVWQGSGILVTIIGWLAVIKGIAYIFFPQALRTGVSRAKAPMTGVVVLALVVGIALLYVGYTLPAGSAMWQQNTPAQHYEMPAAPYPTNSL